MEISQEAKLQARIKQLEKELAFLRKKPPTSLVKAKDLQLLNAHVLAAHEMLGTAVRIALKIERDTPKGFKQHAKKMRKRIERALDATDSFTVPMHLYDVSDLR